MCVFPIIILSDCFSFILLVMTGLRVWIFLVPVGVLLNIKDSYADNLGKYPTNFILILMICPGTSDNFSLTILAHF